LCYIKYFMQHKQNEQLAYFFRQEFFRPGPPTGEADNCLLGYSRLFSARPKEHGPGDYCRETQSARFLSESTRRTSRCACRRDLASRRGLLRSSAGIGRKFDGCAWYSDWRRSFIWSTAH